MPADPVDRDVIRATLEETKGANEGTTKGPWESMAGGLGQGWEKKEKTRQQHAGSGGNLLSLHQHRGFGPAEKVQLPPPSVQFRLRRCFTSL